MRHLSFKLHVHIFKHKTSVCVVTVSILSFESLAVQRHVNSPREHLVQVEGSSWGFGFAQGHFSLNY